MRGGFSLFSTLNTTQNNKNISFLIFFGLNIWWYIKFDISLQCQNKITNRLKQQDYEDNKDLQSGGSEH